MPDTIEPVLTIGIAETSHILAGENCWQALMHFSVILTAIHLQLAIT